MMNVRHFFLPTVRPSFLPREETCDATQLARPAEEALKRALSVIEGEIGCILGNVYLLKKTAYSPRHFLHNKSSHGAPVRPAPVSIALKNSPSKDRPVDFFTFASAGREET